MGSGPVRCERVTAYLTLGIAAVVVAAFVFGGVLPLLSYAWIVGLAGIVVIGWFKLGDVAVPPTIGRDSPFAPGPSPAKYRGEGSSRSMSDGLILWGWIAAACVVAGHVVVNGLLRFPTDYDCLTYHLPMIDQWLQAGSLYVPDSSHWWSPGTSELIGATFAAPFAGDFLVSLNNSPFVVLLAAAAVSVGKELGLRTGWAHLAAGASLATYALFDEIIDASNDLAVAALFLAAAYFGLRLRRSLEPRAYYANLLLCGAAIGLLAGVKYFAMGYAALAWTAAVACAYERVGPRRALIAGVIAIAPALLTGGYWYLRNWATSGLPTFPMGWSGGTKAFGYPNLFTTTLVGNGDPRKWLLAVRAVWVTAGPVHLAALACAAFIVPLGAWWALRKDRGDGDVERRFCWRWAALVLAGTFAIAVVTPFFVEDAPGTLNHLRWAYTPTRYSLCFLCVSVFGLAMILQDVPERFQQLAAALFGAALAVQIGLRLVHAGREWDVVSALLVAAGLFAVVVGWNVLRRVPQARWIGRPAAVALVLIATGVVGVRFLAQRWHSGYDAHFNGFFGTTIFTELPRQFPHLDRICVLDSRIYEFHGASRQIQVFRPTHLESFEQFQEYLCRHDIRIVATSHGGGGVFGRFDTALAGLRTRPDLFAPVLQGEQHVVYRFNRELSAAEFARGEP